MTRAPIVSSFAILALAGLAACADAAPPPVDTPTAAPVSPASPLIASDYVTMAAQSDAYERQAGMLALDASGNAQVQSFARMMVQDHATSSAQLSDAARAAGLTPPPTMLRPDQQRMLADLRRASGPDFDRTYMTQQVVAHQQALRIHSAYAENGDNPMLKAAAAMIAPVVRHHLDMAQMIQAGLH